MNAPSQTRRFRFERRFQNLDLKLAQSKHNIQDGAEQAPGQEAPGAERRGRDSKVTSAAQAPNAAAAHQPVAVTNAGAQHQHHPANHGREAPREEQDRRQHHGRSNAQGAVHTRRQHAVRSRRRQGAGVGRNLGRLRPHTPGTTPGQSQILPARHRERTQQRRVPVVRPRAHAEERTRGARVGLPRPRMQRGSEGRQRGVHRIPRGGHATGARRRG